MKTVFFPSFLIASLSILCAQDKEEPESDVMRLLGTAVLCVLCVLCAVVWQRPWRTAKFTPATSTGRIPTCRGGLTTPTVSMVTEGNSLIRCTEHPTRPMAARGQQCMRCRCSTEGRVVSFQRPCCNMGCIGIIRSIPT
ncbi:hypothetical protein OJAV_G00094680 [Oryzias javanicus]|uniref:CTCK domain-containing protein n=1 Tax=Oryzias javanicus TaxID=123683 RepID=A0A3S2UDT0_ORYJA|nr:hypothetical protein OJAV_G00094680 [Oryzias javanicus]